MGNWESEVYQDEDFCYLCTPDRRKVGLAPNVLVVLPERANNGTEIRVCPDCDGNAAQFGTR